MLNNTFLLMVSFVLKETHYVRSSFDLISLNVSPSIKLCAVKNTAIFGGAKTNWSNPTLAKTFKFGFCIVTYLSSIRYLRSARVQAAWIRRWRVDWGRVTKSPLTVLRLQHRNQRTLLSLQNHVLSPVSVQQRVEQGYPLQQTTPTISNHDYRTLLAENIRPWRDIESTSVVSLNGRCTICIWKP